MKKNIIILSLMALSLCFAGCGQNNTVSANAVSENAVSSNSADPWENAEIAVSEDVAEDHVPTLEEQYYDALLPYYPPIVDFDDNGIKIKVEETVSENSISENSVSENIIEELMPEVTERNPFDNELKENEFRFIYNITIEDEDEKTGEPINMSSRVYKNDTDETEYTAMPHLDLVPFTEVDYSSYVGGFAGEIIMDQDMILEIQDQIAADKVKDKDIYDDPEAVVQKVKTKIIDEYYLEVPMYIVVDYRIGNVDEEEVLIITTITAEEFCKQNDLDITQLYYDVIRMEFIDNETYMK